MDNLPAAKRYEKPQTMEALDQSYGLLLYRHEQDGEMKGTLVVRRVMDRATIYLDGKMLGVLDRRLNQSSLSIASGAGHHSLEILLEHQARVNFGNAIDQERKGITEGVYLNGAELTGWDHFSLPLDDMEHMKASSARAGYPQIYKGAFNITEVGDTYMDMRSLQKGILWVNGKLIGRYWSIGPQQALYVPGCWLKRGVNNVKILEMGQPRQAVVSGMDHQVWDTQTDSSTLFSKKDEVLQLADARAVFQGQLKIDNGWQDISFDHILNGRYVVFESTTAYENSPFTAVAEIRFTDENGKEIPREEYRIVFADSEEAEAENGTANLMIDNQPTTFWHTQWSKDKPRQPHQVVIDLAKTRKLKGFRYLPRTDNRSGRVKDYRLYMSDIPFKTARLQY